MTNASPLALSAEDLEEVWSKGNVALLEALYAPDLVDHNPTPGMPAGREGLLHFHRALHTAFSDVVFTADVVVASGDLVARRWTMRGVHRGSFFGIPPSGQPVAMTGIDILRVANGRFCEIWHNEDFAGLLDQIGVPAATAAE
jgi:steroid delta-isomerase-like uncharacterized protein